MFDTCMRVKKNCILALTHYSEWVTTMMKIKLIFTLQTVLSFILCLFLFWMIFIRASDFWLIYIWNGSDFRLQHFLSVIYHLERLWWKYSFLVRKPLISHASYRINYSGQNTSHRLFKDFNDYGQTLLINSVMNMATASLVHVIILVRTHLVNYLL